MKQNIDIGLNKMEIQATGLLVVGVSPEDREDCHAGKFKIITTTT